MATDHKLTRWRRLLLIRDSRVAYVTPASGDRPEKRVRLCICVLCGGEVFYRATQLQAHHIRPKSIFPELALHLDNGVMLCTGHHQGIVHNHNAALDVTRKDRYSGWAAWVVHFNRWNDLTQNRLYNLAQQTQH